MTEIKDTDWAYAAGFVDGEGCIAVQMTSFGRRCTRPERSIGSGYPELRLF